MYDELVSKKYKDAWCYKKNTFYEKWKLNIIIKTILESLSENFTSHKLLDIGGGDGRFSYLIKNELKLIQNAICLDASKFMLGNYEGVDNICQDANDFLLQTNYKFDICMMKECVHHIDNFYESLYDSLNDNGIFIIVTRPREVDYPFSEKANEIWKINQQNSDFYMKKMTDAGFKNVTNYLYEIPIKVKNWNEFVSNRTWSTFSEFTEEEIQMEIENKKEVEFKEKIIIIKGIK